MSGAAFKLVSRPKDKREFIKSNLSNLSIAIYRLNKEGFKERPGYPAYFGNDHGQLLAFEICKEGNDLELSEAIKWFAHIKLNNPQMELLMDDPRPKSLVN